MLNGIQEKPLPTFQKLTNFFHDTFGINNFQIARFCLATLVIAKLFETVLYSVTFKHLALHMFNLVIDILVIAALFFVIKNVSKNSENTSLSLGDVLLSVLRVYAFIGAIFLPILLLIFFASLNTPTSELQEILKSPQYYTEYHVFYFLSEIMMFSSIYFASCKKPPKKKSKARKFVESLLPQRQPALQTVRTN